MLTRSQGKPVLLYLMGMHKGWIADARKFESNFGGGQNGCACVATGNQKYALHSQILFILPQKPGRTPAYPINPSHGNIGVAYQKYENNIHDYHLVKIMNSFLKNIVVAAIDNKWLKGVKDLVMRYTNKMFVELTDWIYIHYGKITPGEIMNNQDTTQASNYVEELTEILFNQIETGQEFKIDGNPPFNKNQLAYMGIAQILSMQEYTHVYCM